MAEQLLSVSGIIVKFGGLIAVNGVDLSIDAGELVGLIGPNGAGKTTLLNSIVGRNRPASGRIRLGKHDITRMSGNRRARMGLGMSHQIVRPFPGMTPLENVALAAGLNRTRNPLAALLSVSRKAENFVAMELLELVGIADAANRDVAELPLGYLKRLEVARAMALAPQLLLLDEPLAGLNQAEAEKLADTIHSINSGGLTIVLIEHNLREVARISQRLVVLNNGEILTQGNPQEVLADPTVHAVYVGEGKKHHAPA